MDNSTEEIRERADIAEIVGQYVALQPAGNGRMKACCPFHDEKTPSFYVSQEKGFFKCFGCGEGGDVFTFLQKIENITFPEAKERLAERYGITLRRENPQNGTRTERQLHRQILSAASEFFQRQFYGDNGWPAQDYAQERGLAQETVTKFAIGYAPDAWDELRDYLHRSRNYKLKDIAAAGLLIERERTEGTHYYDRFRHRLMFPICDTSGHVIAFGGRILSDAETDKGQAKYINSPEGLLFKKSTVLYAYHLARHEVGKRHSLIITEGYMDAIALHEAGFGNTVATLGTALTAQHITLLRRIAPEIIYLCFDGDSAGMKAALRSGPLFAAHNLDVRVVSLPSQDDPDTFVKRVGAEGFEQALQKAKLLGQYRLEQAIAPYDWEILAERKNAIRAGANAIASVPNAAERDAYITWLTERWVQAEGVREPERLRMLENAVQRDVQRMMRRQYQPNKPHEPPKEDSTDVQDTLLESAATQTPKGVLGAQKSLLGAMINHPSWRRYIMEKMPLEQWTEEDFKAFAKVLLDPDAAEWNPAELTEKFAPEQRSLLAELAMDDPQNDIPTEIIIDDWIARTELYWARKSEREILQIVQKKLEKGELISDEERAAYTRALQRTKRIAPPQ